MPAVQLARLKEKIARLAWHFTRPDEFQRDLHALLDIYADRSYHPGQAVPHRPLIPAYYVNPLVMRQLDQELGRLCQENPGATMSLVDTLWSDPYLEPRLLAASLLGHTPLLPPEPVLERLQTWVNPQIDNRVLEAVVGQGSQRLRREMPDRWLVLVEQWLSNRDQAMQSAGLKALLPLIQDRAFENLPRVYRLISSLVETAPNALQADLQQDLQALARRSPAETAYFLRQVVSMSSAPGCGRLVRRCLPAFPEDVQAALRKVLLSRAETTRR